MTEDQGKTKITSLEYINYFERFINKVNLKDRLISTYHDDFENFQSIITNCNESLINLLISRSLITSKNWDESQLNDIFPVSQDFKLSELDELGFNLLNHSTIESFHISFLNSQFFLKNGELIINQAKGQSKFNGAFYTSKEIVSMMCDESFKSLPLSCKGPSFKALDFASGTGNFYFEMVNRSSSFLEIDPIVCAINNVFAFDKDSTALSILKMKACFEFNIHEIKDLRLLSENIYTLDFIEYGLKKHTDKTLGLFNSDNKNKFIIPSHFNLILSNPPYLNLKYNRPGKSLLPESAHSYYSNSIKSTVEKVRRSDAFHHSSSGMLNLYRLSIDLILSKLLVNGVVTIICPSSLFADKTALPIRKELYVNYDLSTIIYFREDANLFEGVTQSTVIFTAKKSKTSDRINIINNGFSFSVSKKLISDCFPKSLEIPLVDEVGWGLIAKLNKFPKLQSLTFIRNKRGELDLTLHKDFVTSKNTSYQLVRGNRLKKDGINRDHEEFVDIESFKTMKSTEYFLHDFEKKRLVCNQISNVDSKIRIHFLISEPTDIIANSCNYLSFLDNEVPVEFYLNQLNSPLLNWYFKTLSSNNHVNNYELDSLPILNHNQTKKESVTAIQNGNLNHLYKIFSLTDKEIDLFQ